mmetsp:Transcript_7303/g.22259  ORF Transcript_7303/g.22259 Transcript_7303/m.22259 type:complete len:662 (+) Transcript_7303:631-2616(+)
MERSPSVQAGDGPLATLARSNLQNGSTGGFGQRFSRVIQKDNEDFYPINYIPRPEPLSMDVLDAPSFRLHNEVIFLASPPTSMGVRSRSEFVFSRKRFQMLSQLPPVKPTLEENLFPETMTKHTLTVKTFNKTPTSLFEKPAPNAFKQFPRLTREHLSLPSADVITVDDLDIVSKIRSISIGLTKLLGKNKCIYAAASEDLTDFSTHQNRWQLSQWKCLAAGTFSEDSLAKGVLRESHRSKVQCSRSLYLPLAQEKPQCNLSDQRSRSTMLDSLGQSTRGESKCHLAENESFTVAIVHEHVLEDSLAEEEAAASHGKEGVNENASNGPEGDDHADLNEGTTSVGCSAPESNNSAGPAAEVPGVSDTQAVAETHQATAEDNFEFVDLVVQHVEEDTVDVCGEILGEQLDPADVSGAKGLDKYVSEVLLAASARLNSSFAAANTAQSTRDEEIKIAVQGVVESVLTSVLARSTAQESGFVFEFSPASTVRQAQRGVSSLLGTDELGSLKDEEEWQEVMLRGGRSSQRVTVDADQKVSIGSRGGGSRGIGSRGGGSRGGSNRVSTDDTFETNSTKTKKITLKNLASFVKRGEAKAKLNSSADIPKVGSSPLRSFAKKHTSNGTHAGQRRSHSAARQRSASRSGFFNIKLTDLLVRGKRKVRNVG